MIAHKSILKLCTEDEHITIHIPKFIQYSVNSFTPKKENDISHRFNITLLTQNGEQQLYVDNEKVLRDVLKLYCLYKQILEKVEIEKENLKKSQPVNIKEADDIIGADDILQGMLFRDPPVPPPIQTCAPVCKHTKEEEIAIATVNESTVTDPKKKCCRCCTIL